VGIAWWKLWDRRELMNRKFRSWDDELLPITVFFSVGLCHEGVASLRQAVRMVNTDVGHAVFDNGTQVDFATQERIEEQIALDLDTPTGVLLCIPCSEESGLSVKVIRNVAGHITFALVRLPLYAEMQTHYVRHALYVALGLTLDSAELLITERDIAKIRDAFAVKLEPLKLSYLKDLKDLKDEEEDEEESAFDDDESSEDTSFEAEAETADGTYDPFNPYDPSKATTLK
jgi:hypothetical protein